MKEDLPYRPEPLWHVELAVLVAIIIQLTLSSHLTVGPRYLLCIMGALLLVALRLTAPVTHDLASRLRRFASLLLTGLITFANTVSLVLVSRFLINGNHSTGKELIFSAIAIYLTNIIIFALWYWELDGGGHGGRGTHKPPVDFLFPQMNTPDTITKQPSWRPMFVDYLFVSLTNGTAFSPTDALPLTHRAKLLMGIQALTSLATVALLAARAVNVLA